MLLAALLTLPPDFSLVDSRTDSTETYLLVDQCKIPLKKNRLKDWCYIDKMMLQECGITFELGENCEKK